MTKNTSKKFEDLNLDQLKNLVSSLRLYKDLTSKLWNRWKKLFWSIIWNKSLYRVEYFESISEDEAYKQASIAYKNVFWDTPKKEEITFQSKKSLDGGVRVYKDDSLLDFSFKKVENILK